MADAKRTLKCRPVVTCHQNTPSNRCGRAMGLNFLIAPALDFFTPLRLLVAASGAPFWTPRLLPRRFCEGTLVPHVVQASCRRTITTGLSFTGSVVKIRKTTCRRGRRCLPIRNAALTFNIGVTNRLGRLARGGPPYFYLSILHPESPQFSRLRISLSMAAWIRAAVCRSCAASRSSNCSERISWFCPSN